MSRVKLGDIAEILAGPFGTQLHKSEYVTNGITMLNAKNIGNGEVLLDSVDYVSDKVCDRLPMYVLQEGDILFGRAGSIERHAYVSKKYAGSFQGTNCIRIRCENTEIALYISYYLWFPQVKQVIENKTSGSVLSYITTDLLKDITVEISDERTMSAITKLLHSIDEKRRLNCEVNDNLEQQIKLLYEYWFVQFDFPDENGKPYCSSGGKMVWNEQLKRDIPISWLCTKMKTSIEAIRTGLNPRDNFKLGSGKIKYITVKNLRLNGSLDFSVCDTIDENARQIVHHRSDIRVGDILFASIAPLGRCYLIQDAPSDWDINESVFSIRCNSSIISPEYLYLYMKSEVFVKESTACSTGSIFKGIRINSLMDSKIVIPPYCIIEKFSKEVKPLIALQNELNKESNILTQYRDWLLPMLLNGQATISD